MGLLQSPLNWQLSIFTYFHQCLTKIISVDHHQAKNMKNTYSNTNNHDIKHLVFTKHPNISHILPTWTLHTLQIFKVFIHFNATYMHKFDSERDAKPCKYIAHRYFNIGLALQQWQMYLFQDPLYITFVAPKPVNFSLKYIQKKFYYCQ